MKDITIDTVVLHNRGFGKDNFLYHYRFRFLNSHRLWLCYFDKRSTYICGKISDKILKLALDCIDRIFLWICKDSYAIAFKRIYDAEVSKSILLILNCEEFDYLIIQNECRILKHGLSDRYFCTENISRYLIFA